MANRVSEMTPEEVRETREALRLSQVQFAELLGVDKGTPSAWETGRYGVGRTAAILIRLFRYAASFSSLLDDVREEHRP